MERRIVVRLVDNRELTLRRLRLFFCTEIDFIFWLISGLIKADCFVLIFKKSKKELLVAQLYYMVSLCAGAELNPLRGNRDIHRKNLCSNVSDPRQGGWTDWRTGLNTVGAHLTKWKFGSISKVKWMTVKFLHSPKGEYQLVHEGIGLPPPPQ